MTMTMRELIYKAENQKTIKAELVLEAVKPFYENYQNLKKEKQESLNRANKTNQLLKNQLSDTKKQKRNLEDVISKLEEHQKSIDKDAYLNELKHQIKLRDEKLLKLTKENKKLKLDLAERLPL